MEQPDAATEQHVIAMESKFDYDLSDGSFILSVSVDRLISTQQESSEDE